MPQNNEVDDFLAGLEGESKEDPFVPVTEDPLAPTVEEKPVVEAKVEEKPVPFHKDPKVQKFIEKEISKRMADIKLETPVVVDDNEDEMTDVLTRIIGNDTPQRQAAIKDFKKVLGGLEEKGAQKALAQLQEQADFQHQQDIEAEEELTQGFDDIEETYGVDLSGATPSSKKTRDEFIDYITRIAPKKDGEIVNYPDLVASFEEFQDKQKRSAPSNARAKDLASRSTQRSGDASIVPEAGRDYSWKGVEKAFSKIKS